MSGDVAFVLDSTSHLAAPLMFVALGELVAERAGTLNISVEAMMLGSAFAGAAVSSATQVPLLGLVAGAAAGLSIAAAQAVTSHRLTVNQFIVGLTLNVLVLGITSFVLSEMTLSTKQFGILRVPGLASTPYVGPALFQQRWPFFLLYVIVPLVWWIIHRSRWGMELQAVGENPAAAEVTGIPVNVRRRQALYFCGVLAGLGGAYLSVGVIGTFSQDMTAERGFIAIAAVIFGRWTLTGTLLGCLLFGAADALRLAVPALGVQVNPQLLIAAPYLLALFALLFVAGANRQPAALGMTFRTGSG